MFPVSVSAKGKAKQMTETVEECLVDAQGREACQEVSSTLVPLNTKELGTQVVTKDRPVTHTDQQLEEVDQKNTVNESNQSGVVNGQQEMLLWDRIKSSTNRADFEAFLKQYPNGRFAVLAKNRLNPPPIVSSGTQDSAQPKMDRMFKRAPTEDKSGSDSANTQVSQANVKSDSNPRHTINEEHMKMLQQIEMLENIERKEHEEFSSLINQANHCIVSRDFSCAESYLTNAQKSATNSSDKNTLQKSVDNLAAERSRMEAEERSRQRELARREREEEKERRKQERYERRLEEEAMAESQRRQSMANLSQYIAAKGAEVSSVVASQGQAANQALAISQRIQAEQAQRQREKDEADAEERRERQYQKEQARAEQREKERQQEANQARQREQELAQVRQNAQIQARSIPPNVPDFQTSQTSNETRGDVNHGYVYQKVGVGGEWKQCEVEKSSAIYWAKVNRDHQANEACNVDGWAFDRIEFQGYEQAIPCSDGKQWKAKITDSSAICKKRQ